MREIAPPGLVANLRNVDEDLAQRVADGLGIDLLATAQAARQPVDVAPSDARSIHKKMKTTLEGCAVGGLIGDGTDAGDGRSGDRGGEGQGGDRRAGGRRRDAIRRH